MDDFILYLLGLNKKINSVDLSIVLREKYETFFDVFNHDKVNPTTGASGLALVAMHPPEDLSYIDYKRDQLMEKFMNYKIGTYFNCSWMEFIKQEWCEVERMIKLAKPRAIEDLRNLNHVSNEIDSLAKKL